MSTDILAQHIVVDPTVSGGKPRIKGRRITVQQIALWYERQGMGADEIATAYDLSLGDVYAALAYYHDHRTEIDASMRSDAAFVAELRARTPSKLRDHRSG